MSRIPNSEERRDHKRRACEEPPSGSPSYRRVGHELRQVARRPSCWLIVIVVACVGAGLVAGWLVSLSAALGRARVEVPCGVIGPMRSDDCGSLAIAFWMI